MMSDHTGDVNAIDAAVPTPRRPDGPDGVPAGIGGEVGR